MFSHHRNTDNNVSFISQAWIGYFWAQYLLVSVSFFDSLIQNKCVHNKVIVAELVIWYFSKLDHWCIGLCPAAVGDPSWSVLSTCHLLSTVAFKALLKSVDEFCSRGGSFEHQQRCSRGSKRQVKAVESEGWAAVKSNHPSPLKSTLSGVSCANLILICRNWASPYPSFLSNQWLSEIGGRRTQSLKPSQWTAKSWKPSIVPPGSSLVSGVTSSMVR